MIIRNHSQVARITLVMVGQSKYLTFASYSSSLSPSWVVNYSPFRTLTYHTAPVWSLQQKRDNLISGSHDKTVSYCMYCIMWSAPPTHQAVVWDIRHCKLKQQLVGHDGAVFAVDLDEKAKIAYTGSGDRVCTKYHKPKMFTLNTFACLKKKTAFPIMVEMKACLVVITKFTKDASCECFWNPSIVLWHYIGDVHSQTIRQWDIHTGRCIRIIKASKTDPVLSLHLQQVN